AVAQPEQRRRAEQLRLRHLDLLGDGGCGRAGGLGGGGAGDDADQVRERWILVRLAARELLFEEAVAVVVGGGDDRRGVGGARLPQHHVALGHAPRTA